VCVEPFVTRVIIMGTMTTENVRMGNRIRDARESRGWTKADLARKAGVAPSYITRIEQGAFTRPSIDLVSAIAAAFKVGVTDLIDRAPSPAMADLRAALMAKGFRPDETHIVDQILDDLASKDDEQRQQLLDALSVLLASRAAR
jgi:transcriptional regulator with XRE-family HTH domain